MMTSTGIDDAPPMAHAVFLGTILGHQPLSDGNGNITIITPTGIQVYSLEDYATLLANAFGWSTETFGIDRLKELSHKVEAFMTKMNKRK